MQTANPRETANRSTRRHRPDSYQRPRFKLALPEKGWALDQDEEWCLLNSGGQWREIRFHDYAEIYCVPGLYEHLFHRVLRCKSPRVVCGLLGRALRAADESPEKLRVFDLGAGNGMVGEQLVRLGAQRVFGVDLLPEARAAAERDRPGTYADYFAGDLSEVGPDLADRLRAWECNALACVAALGFGDIPAAVFLNALRFVAEDGWVAFNIRSRFLKQPDSDFACLIAQLRRSGALEIVQEVTYRHRYATSGAGLPYTAVVARLRRPQLDLADF